MMASLNRGELFYYEQESVFAMRWRLISSNQSYPWSLLKSALSHQTAFASHKAFNTYESSDTIYQNRNINNFKESRPLRGCPECIKYHYHSAIFELPWLTRCPIHECPLTTDCPACKQPWPTYFEYINRQCILCGKVPLQTWLRSSLTQKDRLDTSNIERLWQLVNTLPNDVFLIDAEHSNRPFEHDVNSCCAHRRFGDLLLKYYQFNNRDKDLAFLQSLIAKESKVYRYKTELSILSPRNHLDPIPLYWKLLLNVRFQAFKDILMYIDQKTPCYHQSHLFIPRVFSGKSERYELCPYCFALNIWIRYHCAYPCRESAWSDAQHDDYLEVLPTSKFVNVIPVTHVYRHSSTNILIDSKYTFKDYRQRLLQLFVQILSSMCQLLQYQGFWLGFIKEKLEKEVNALNERFFTRLIYILDFELYSFETFRNPLELLTEENIEGSTEFCEQWLLTDDHGEHEQLANTINSLEMFEHYEYVLKADFNPHKIEELKMRAQSWFFRYQKNYAERAYEFSQLEMKI